MLEIRRFPDSWEKYEQDLLLFLHSGRERLSKYLQLILKSEDIDDANYYQRYTNLYYKWSSIILSSKHPLEEKFEDDPSIKTKNNEQYLKEWKQYLIDQVSSIEMEIRLVQYNLMGKMMRYRPPRSGMVFPD